jgi:FKBP-type peptidyl-prolyl cis-trans isomerase FklB
MQTDNRVNTDMRIRIAIMLLSVWPLATALAQEAPSLGKLVTPEQRISYYVGLQLGDMLDRFEDSTLPLDRALVLQAINDEADGRLVLSDADIATLRGKYLTFEMDRSSASLAPDEQNAREGAAFLARNRLLPGVLALPSGLQYKELRPGNGPLPNKNGKVTVHYSGRLIDGSEFDSSYFRGEADKFRVTSVIPGWTEALRLMPEGAHWELYIPPDLAYGSVGSRPDFGPDTTLIFRIEMIKSR